MQTGEQERERAHGMGEDRVLREVIPDGQSFTGAWVTTDQGWTAR